LKLWKIKGAYCSNSNQQKNNANEILKKNKKSQRMRQHPLACNAFYRKELTTKLLTEQQNYELSH